MGEVYRARDTKLGREVALKILPAGSDQIPIASRGSSARRGCWRRSITPTSPPSMAWKTAEPVTALVMEVVDGDTLAERLLAGALRCDDPGSPSDSSGTRDRAPARRRARGRPRTRHRPSRSEAGEREGHPRRDRQGARLRPGEARDGSGFGGATCTPVLDVSHSPTVLSSGTRAGVMLGTAPYMSPEQARGSPVDKRTDIWAFGCVLYEMLTGRRAFEGDSVADVLVAILHHDPDWSALPEHTPAGPSSPAAPMHGEGSATPPP